ncbi:MAG: hypothetical protein FWB85_05775 [Chitinispirillia bacterium]|nr:hypothetical protein [Chitinispirillia bacterium]
MTTTPTVNILGLRYTVRHVPYIERDVFRAGQIDHEKQEIKVLDSLTAEHSEVTLLHEVVHGILAHLKCWEEHNDEKLVQGLAIGLHQYLKGSSEACIPTLTPKKEHLHEQKTNLKTGRNSSKQVA